jgi:hypothetical protein
VNVCEETLEPARTRVKLQTFIIFKTLADLHTVEVPGWVEVVDLLGFDCVPDQEKCLLRQNGMRSFL